MTDGILAGGKESTAGSRSLLLFARGAEEGGRGVRRMGWARAGAAAFLWYSSCSASLRKSREIKGPVCLRPKDNPGCWIALVDNRLSAARSLEEEGWRLVSYARNIDCCGERAWAVGTNLASFIPSIARQYSKYHTGIYRYVNMRDH